MNVGKLSARLAWITGTLLLQGCATNAIFERARDQPVQRSPSASGLVLRQAATDDVRVYICFSTTVTGETREFMVVAPPPALNLRKDDSGKAYLADFHAAHAQPGCTVSGRELPVSDAGFAAALAGTRQTFVYHERTSSAFSLYSVRPHIGDTHDYRVYVGDTPAFADRKKGNRGWYALMPLALPYDLVTAPILFGALMLFGPH
jgi:hypothetical protein